MKFATVLIIALLPAAASGSSLRGAPSQLRSSQSFSLGVNASFVLNSGDDLTTDEQNFAKYSIRESYNAVHNTHAILMQFADIVDASAEPIPQALHQDSTSIQKLKQPFNWALGISTIGDCSLCGPSLATDSNGAKPVEVLVADQLAWELELCNELNNGPFDTFQGISNCTIEFFMPETGNSMDVQDMQMDITSNFTLPLERDLTVDEQFFANECLRLSYNQVHDPATVFMATSDLTNQTYQSVLAAVAGELHDIEIQQSGSFSWALEWTAMASFYNVAASDDDSSSSARTTLVKGLQQQHNRWQVVFCAMLSSGPFSAFQSVDNCAISVNDVAPVAAVALKK
jgi:hypothetical protein